MTEYSQHNRYKDFYPIKIDKIQQLAKNVIALNFSIPENLKSIFKYRAGQYVSLRFQHEGEWLIRDYSITTAPYEEQLNLAIKINSERSGTQSIKKYKAGDVMEISAPDGRFTLVSKPHEFRTIIAFAGGIGITPIFSHIKNLLHTEPRTRIYLFYSNKTREDIVFYDELNKLSETYSDRFQVFYFYTQENMGNPFFFGRIDEKKLRLIINQILHLDDTDEESTLWDSVDEVLICGKGEMIKSLANTCFEEGIRKQNIHFELFEEFNDKIYPEEVQIPPITDINLEYKYNLKNYTTSIAENTVVLLDSLLEQKLPVPYSCRSGICGICICKVEQGEVEQNDNEYLTDKELAEGKILVCCAYAKSKEIKLNFDI